jgi:hypothetical protein
MVVRIQYISTIGYYISLRLLYQILLLGINIVNKVASRCQGTMLVRKRDDVLGEETMKTNIAS